MKPLEFPLLTDENIHIDVVRTLTSRGKDVRSVFMEGLVGKSDAEILRHARAQGRVVLTHDSDFGTLVYRSRQPFVGIIYLRPGHIAPAFVLETLAVVEAATIEVTPPFLIVAERKDDFVRMKYRISEAF